MKIIAISSVLLLSIVSAIASVCAYNYYY